MDGFASLKALVSGQSTIDVPVPACLHQCINQEIFNCKVLRQTRVGVRFTMPSLPSTMCLF